MILENIRGAMSTLEVIQQEIAEESNWQKFLTFRIKNEDYAIGIGYISEIIRIQKITHLPKTVHYVKGVINLRGKVIPVIDVRKRFSIEEKEYDDRTCIIVVDLLGIVIGLIVDFVSEVMDIDEEKIEPSPQTGKNTQGRFIKGMGKVYDGVKIILDVDKLLYDDHQIASGE